MSFSFGVQCKNNFDANKLLNYFQDSLLFLDDSLLRKFIKFRPGISLVDIPYIDEPYVFGLNTTHFTINNSMSTIYSFLYIISIKNNIYTEINGSNFVVLLFEDEKVIIGKENPNIDGYQFMLIDDNFVVVNYKTNIFSFIKHIRLKRIMKKIQKQLPLAI